MGQTSGRAGIAPLSPAADLSGGEAHIGRRLAPGAEMTGYDWQH